MSKSQKKRVFAGLSTGVKLEQYARSILRQVQSINRNATISELGDDGAHFSVEPMLLALSMEFALKAWFAYDHDEHDSIKTHNLVKLFDALSDDSKKRLNNEFKRTVAPKYPSVVFIDYSITDVLHQHANAFVEWRYLHEERTGGLSFDTSTFIATLELILDGYGKRYITHKLT